jgi:hypothetical protein
MSYRSLLEGRFRIGRRHSITQLVLLAKLSRVPTRLGGAVAGPVRPRPHKKAAGEGTWVYACGAAVVCWLAPGGRDGKGSRPAVDSVARPRGKTPHLLTARDHAPDGQALVIRAHSRSVSRCRPRVAGSLEVDRG